MTVAVAPLDKRPFPLRVARSRRSLLPLPWMARPVLEYCAVPPIPSTMHCCTSRRPEVLASLKQGNKIP